MVWTFFSNCKAKIRVQEVNSEVKNSATQALSAVFIEKIYKLDLTWSQCH